MNLLLQLLFPNPKSKHLRKLARDFLNVLKKEKYVSVKQAKELIPAKKSYYKVVGKLKEFGLIEMHKDLNGNFCYSLSIPTFKFFIKRNLIEAMEKWYNERMS